MAGNRNPRKRQEAMLACIRSSLERRGFPPSVRELQDAAGLKSPSSVVYHLKRLEEQGAIRRSPATSRSIELTEKPPASAGVPLLGQVPAGMPLLAEENFVDLIGVPAAWLGEGRHFALTVRGDSMVGAGIMDGDIVVLRSTQQVEQGTIGVAMIDGEATVKRIFYDADHVRLMPENPAYPPITSRTATIVGKVVGLIRTYP